MKNSVITNLLLAGVSAAVVTCAQGQSSFSISLVADNDFAVFGGTATGVNDLVYQNDSSWHGQADNPPTVSFVLPAGDTMFYVLGLGGGEEENISGSINGVDLTTVNVSMSSDIGPYLTSYELENNLGTVAAGTFNANLADVQTGFPFLTWGSPNITSSGTVIAIASPNGFGFSFPTSTAHLFSFLASDVGVQAVPEPSSLGLAALGGAALLFYRRRRI